MTTLRRAVRRLVTAVAARLRRLAEAERPADKPW